MKAGVSPFLAVAVLLLVACEGTSLGEQCLFELGHVNPNATALAVGDTLTYAVSVWPSGCLRAGLDPTAWRWTSGDTLIASIDSVTGLAHALSPGQVMIAVQHTQDPNIGGESTLNVVPPGP